MNGRRPGSTATRFPRWTEVIDSVFARENTPQSDEASEPAPCHEPTVDYQNAEDAPGPFEIGPDRVRSSSQRFRVLSPMPAAAWERSSSPATGIEPRGRAQGDPGPSTPTTRTPRRFLLEAEITGGLEHPGIVPVYGLGHDADGRPYYAMRFIRGESLKEAIERFHAADGPERDPGERSLELRKLLRRFIDVCNAVAYAHSRGVLHRDLKPANMMLGPYGETLVVDWGLAKAVGRDAGRGRSRSRPSRPPTSAATPPRRSPGSALGTPPYMSPEQAAGQLDRLGPASDVYSLGATLYHLLTGRAPFPDGDLATVLGSGPAGRLPAASAVNPRVPRALEAICLKAMALRPGGPLRLARAPGRGRRALAGRRAGLGPPRIPGGPPGPLGRGGTEAGPWPVRRLSC